MFKEGSFFKQENKELVFYVLGPPKTKSYSIHTPTSIVMFPDVLVCCKNSCLHLRLKRIIVYVCTQRYVHSKTHEDA